MASIKPITVPEFNTDAYAAAVANFKSTTDGRTPEEKAAVVELVIEGNTYGSGEERKDKLAKEGYNPQEIQNLVNQRLGIDVVADEYQLTPGKVVGIKGESNPLYEEFLGYLHELGHTNYSEDDISSIDFLDNDTARVELNDGNSYDVKYYTNSNNDFVSPIEAQIQASLPSSDGSGKPSNPYTWDVFSDSTSNSTLNSMNQNTVNAASFNNQASSQNSATSSGSRNMNTREFTRWTAQNDTSTSPSTNSEHSQVQPNIVNILDVMNSRHN